MAKFYVDCPVCGQYTLAKTGLFAKKNISCTCGNTINIRQDKLSSRECPKCGSIVLVDESKNRSVHCPVCKKTISRKNSAEVIEFNCEQCGVQLFAPRDAKAYSCPVCEHKNDVTVLLKKKQLSTSGLANIIKYEGDNETLVWKHPVEDFNLGSQLIVHESQEAIFYRDGQALDLFGAGRYTLETQQLPILEKLYALPSDSQGTFHSEVYFFNMATQMGVKWGTDSKVRLLDPVSGMYIELGASGEFNIRITNSRKLLLKLVGTTAGLQQKQLLGSNSNGIFRTMVMTQVKSYLGAVIREKGINILEIDSRLMELSEALRERINPILEDYGLTMPEFFVGRIVTPDDDPNFRKMKEQYAERYLGVRQEQIRRDVAEAEAQRRVVEAQTAAQMKIIGAQGEAEALRIQKAAEAEAYRLQAEAEAAEMKMKGYTYQQETSRMVGLEALQNGLTGGGSGSGEGGGIGGFGALGDIANLGMTLGAMGGVINMTKDVMAPMMDTASQIGKSVGTTIAGGWDCTCGNTGITGNFCGNCGAKRPEPAAPATWDCSCGNRGITTIFCGNCGKKRGE